MSRRHRRRPRPPAPRACASSAPSRPARSSSSASRSTTSSSGSPATGSREEVALATGAVDVFAADMNCSCRPSAPPAPPTARSLVPGQRPRRRRRRRDADRLRRGQGRRAGAGAHRPGHRQLPQAQGARPVTSRAPHRRRRGRLLAPRASSAPSAAASTRCSTPSSRHAQGRLRPGELHHAARPDQDSRPSPSPRS